MKGTFLINCNLFYLRMSLFYYYNNCLFDKFPNKTILSEVNVGIVLSKGYKTRQLVPGRFYSYLYAEK